MSAIPGEICRFIAQHHVVSLACQHNGQLWCASCFYLFDEPAQRLIVLTSQTSRHGQMMLANPHIAGTIAGQPLEITEIEGVQFTAEAHCLKGRQQAVAFQQFLAKFPIAAAISGDVWEVYFTQIKYTCNREQFGKKTLWQKA